VRGRRNAAQLNRDITIWRPGEQERVVRKSD